MSATKNQPLSDEQRRAFKATLTEKRKTLADSEMQREAQTLRGAEAQDEQVERDGSREADEDLSTGLMEVELSELVEIDDALERLSQGTYGTCEECDVEIGVKRLTVRPEARYCVSCQQELENDQERRRRPHEVPDFRFPEDT